MVDNASSGGNWGVSMVDNASSGRNWGVAMVDKEFYDLLVNIAGKAITREVAWNDRSDYLDLFWEFEVKKIKFNPERIWKFTYGCIKSVPNIRSVHPPDKIYIENHGTENYVDVLEKKLQRLESPLKQEDPSMKLSMFLRTKNKRKSLHKSLLPSRRIRCM
ncbi:hypothetical protein CHS0354_026326 [Potamilus streckersoni]|uniref:Uncharacterized protein n=1 Tax=Potamilus streckersoni TaxID=2493646 RepID=A0AAE0T3E9_9BIVA|nr:hypothetical protein CHS0354_026326 [Potamilus streckersoni]